MKIAIASDAHLLYQAEWTEDEKKLREEEQEVLDNFEKAMKEVAKKSPSAIILAGDMFDTKAESGQRVTHREAEKYMQRIRQVLGSLSDETGSKIYVLRGNHDSEPVLKSLEGVMQGRLQYAGNRVIDLDGLKVALMDTHYLTGYYEIPEEDIPKKADILVMHESVPLPNIQAPPKETFVTICNGFGRVFNGHMHFYKDHVLDIKNFCLLPAFIPSRRIKNNWMLKLRYSEGHVESQSQPSPFGFMLLDEKDSEFVRYTPHQIIVRVELLGKDASDFVNGIQRVYETLMEHENRDRLRVWVGTNADKITIDRVLRERVQQFPEIRTIDILAEGWEKLKAPIPSIEKEFGDVAFTRDELIDRVARSLKGKELEIARGLFEEIFTPQVLERKNPNEAEEFRKLLELVSKGERVSDLFVQRAYDLQKERASA